MSHYTPLYESICTSARMADLPDDACRLFYTWLLAKCDAWGRHDARARKLNVSVWPMLGKSDAETARALAALASAGLVEIYRPPNADSFVQVPDWEEKAGVVGRKSHRRASRHPDPQSIPEWREAGGTGEAGQCRAEPGIAVVGARAVAKAGVVAEAVAKAEATGRSETWAAVLEEPEFAKLLADPVWMAAWRDWIEHARTSGTKARVPKAKGARQQFRYALEVGPAKHIEAIHASMRNDWQGIDAGWGGGRAAKQAELPMSHGRKAIEAFKAQGGSFTDQERRGA